MTRVTITRQEVDEILRTWVNENPPSRFALYEVFEDEHGHDGEVIAWGLRFDDHLVAQSPDYSMRGRFTSADSLLHVFGAGADVEIVWIDPE
jgi:hypothetical protein